MTITGIRNALVAGAPAFVDPPLVSGSDLDVAPYATMIPVADVMRAARASKGRLFHGDERGPRLDAFIEFLDDGEVEGKHWVAAQLEPPAVAGRATASARTDPDVPPADDD